MGGTTVLWLLGIKSASLGRPLIDGARCMNTSLRDANLSNSMLIVCAGGSWIRGIEFLRFPFHYASIPEVLVQKRYKSSNASASLLFLNLSDNPDNPSDIPYT